MRAAETKEGGRRDRGRGEGGSERKRGGGRERVIILERENKKVQEIYIIIYLGAEMDDGNYYLRLY